MVTEKSVLDKETISLTLRQVELVDLDVTAQLKDDHTLIIWQHHGYRTRQGEYCRPEGLLLVE